MSRDQPAVVQLPAAGVPADQGLSSLGLVMQLGGTIAAIAVTPLAFAMLFGARSPGTLWLFLLLATCVVRSLFHRAAGTDILYGKPRADGASAPLVGLVRYIAIGLAHSVLIAVAAGGKFDAPAGVALGLGVGLAVWPALLGILLATGLFSRFASKVPVAEDKGFEGAAILMTVLGLCGALIAGTMLLAIVGTGMRAMREGRVLLMSLALLMLMVRSALHVRAGLSGMRSTSIDRAVEHASQYASFGIVSAFCAGGAMLLGVMTTKLDITMLTVVSGLTWMLMAWPMIVRRFFGDRQFADLLAGEHAEIHRRAPDAGLTCLGWLLLAHAAYSLTFAAPALFTDHMPSSLERLFALFDSATYSPWWTVGIHMFEIWAGYELIRMSIHHRIVVTAYGVVIVVLTLYLSWPELRGIEHLKLSDPEAVASLLTVGLALVIPAAALLLVNRKLAPAATARFKR